MKPASPFSTATLFGLVLAVATVTAGCSLVGAPPPVSLPGPRDLGPVTAASFSGNRPAVVSVTYAARTELSRMVDAGLEIWYVDQDAKRAYGQVAADALPALQRLGAQLRMVQAPGVYNDFDRGYHTYDEIKQIMTGMAAKHADKARLVDIGDGWEKTQGKSDRDILALQIGKGDKSGKPAILLCGNHHAREIVTPEIVLKIAEMLLEGSASDPDLAHYVENRDIWLIPMVNPDGHRLAAKGVDWRKNTDNTAGGGSDYSSGPNGPGVDLNRNYGFKWGLPGASPSAKAPTFRGPGPFSEPETQAIKNLVESRKWAFLMTYHSFSNLILWPWGHTNAAPPDKRLAPIGQKLGALAGYRPQQSVKLYPTSGDTTDWAFGAHGILSYTTEIGSWGDGFDPPYAKLPKFWKQNEPGARLLLQLADNPAHIFGPELTEVAVRGGAIEVNAERGSIEVEAFVGKAGPDGSGAKVPVVNGRALIPGDVRSPNGLVLLHARDAKGAWGPIKAVFKR